MKRQLKIYKLLRVYTRSVCYALFRLRRFSLSASPAGLRAQYSLSCNKVLLLLVFFLSGSCLLHAQVSGNLNLLYGRKILEDTWAASEQDEFGAELDFKDKEWPFSVVFGFRAGTDKGTADKIFTDEEAEVVDEIETETLTREYYAGIRKIFGNELKLAFGAGAAYIEGEAEFEGIDPEDDSNIGGWASASIYRPAADVINVGAMIRYSYAEIDLGDEKLNGGGFYYGIMAGLNF